jgi:chromosome segregation ATPase
VEEKQVALGAEADRLRRANEDALCVHVSELAQASSEREDLRRSLEKAVEDLGESRGREEALHSELTAVKDTLTAQEAELDVCRAVRGQLEQAAVELQGLHAEKARLVQDLVASKADVERLEDVNSAVGATALRLESELCDVRTSLTSKDAVIEDLHTELCVLRESLSAKCEEIGRLEVAHEASKHAIEELEVLARDNAARERDLLETQSLSAASLRDELEKLKKDNETLKVRPAASRSAQLAVAAWKSSS